MKTIPNRSNAIENDGAMSLVIIGALIIFIILIVAGAFATRTIEMTWRSAGHAYGHDHVGGADDHQHDADHANDDGAPPPVTTITDSELNALLSAEEDVIEEGYSGARPLLPVAWAAPRGDAYAFTDGSTIFFVKAQYERDNWPLNLEVMRHEVAHAAVGTQHRHDAVWKREFDRLMALAPHLRALDDRTSD